MIWLSLKTYKEATAENAVKLLLSAKKVMSETGVPIIACAQATDIYRISQEVGIEVWAQHVEPIDPGKHSGWISPYAVKQAGATGVIINHSEHPLTDEVVMSTNAKAKEYGLKTFIVCDSAERVAKFSQLDADYISYENPQLIAGQISVIDQEAEQIREMVVDITQPFIVGAGVTTGEQIKKARALGAKGIFIATAVVTAPDPEVKLRELAGGFMNAI